MLSATLILFNVFVLCDGAVTISPSGSLDGVAGQIRSINCTFLDVSGTNSLLYNENQSSPIDIAGVSAQLSVQGTLFTGVTDFLGRAMIQGSSVVIMKISFVLISAYDGASLKCRFLRAGESIPIDSSPLSLNVFFSPCCNVSDSSIERNSTDQPSQLRLNCSDIIQKRGKPLANISWTVVPQSSGCIGTPAGDANRFYYINPIVRKCNDVKIICIADAKDTRLDITTKTFDLSVNSVPGAPQAPNTLPVWRAKPLPNGAGIEWQPPLDNGGFKVLNYQYTVLDFKNSVVTSDTTTKLSVDVMELDVAANYTFTVTAGNVLGRGPALTVPFSSPDVPRAVSNVSARAIDTKTIEISWEALTVDVATELEVTGYMVSLLNATGNETVLLIPADKTSATFSDLLPGTYYNFSVYAVNGVKGGQPRQTFVTGRTNLPGFPATPIIKTADATPCESVTLKWQSVDAGGEGFMIERYVIQVLNNGNLVKEETQDVGENRGPEVQYVVRGLKEKTLYKFQVAAENQVRRGSFSEAKTATTTECSSSSALAIGLGVGIPLGLLVVVGVILLVYFCCCRESKESGPSSQESARDQKKATGGDGVTYAELQLAQSGPLKENRKEGPTQYSDVKPGYTYADLDLAKPSKGNEEKVKNTKEKESVPYTGVTKLATE